MLDVGDVGVKKIQPVASCNFSLPPSLGHFLLTTQAERTKYEGNIMDPWQLTYLKVKMMRIVNIEELLSTLPILFDVILKIL